MPSPVIVDTTKNPLFVEAGKTLTPFKSIVVTDTDPLTQTETLSVQLPPNPLPDLGVLSNPRGTFDSMALGGRRFEKSVLIGGSPPFASNVLQSLTYTAPPLANGQSEDVKAIVAVRNSVGLTI